nr:hypothetical protein [Tanacetum cinerariifolium]
MNSLPDNTAPDECYQRIRQLVLTEIHFLIQMDVKNAFIYGRIKKEVYVCQPLWFEDPNHPDKVYKVVKVLYDVKSSNTPVDTQKTLVKDADGADVDVHLYRSMIGSLMYLISSRLDIMYAATTKVKTVDGEVQIQALVDKKKVIITETSVRSDLHLKDAKGTKCLPTAIIFEQLTLMGAKITAWNKFSSTLASAIIYLATNQKFNFSKYIFDHMVKNLEDGVKFFRFPRFVQVFLDSLVEGMLKHKEIYVTPSHAKKFFANMKRQGKDVSDEHVTTTANDLLLSGKDRLKLTELMELCTQLQSKVLALETTKANQALEIRSLKRRVKKLEKKASKKSHKFKRLYKIGSSTRVESSKDEGVALGRNDQDMFDTSILDDKEVVVEKEVSTADLVHTAGEVVTTASVEVSTAAITSQISMDEITLAKALIDIKTSKPKAKEIVMQEPTEKPTPIDSSQQPSKAKEKGKAKMIKPGKPLKRKDQIMIDEEVAKNLKAQLQAELKEEERLARQKEEEANIVVIESWDNTQAMMEADYQMARQLQTKNKSNMDTELVKSSKKAAEGSSKRTGGKLEQEDAKREDLKVLWSIVKARFKKTKPVDDMDNLNMAYYLLVEKMYPLTRNILHQMWTDVRLQVDYEAEMAYDLLRLIRRKIIEGYVPE